MPKRANGANFLIVNSPSKHSMEDSFTSHFYQLFLINAPLIASARKTNKNRLTYVEKDAPGVAGAAMARVFYLDDTRFVLMQSRFTYMSLLRVRTVEAWAIRRHTVAVRLGPKRTPLSISTKLRTEYKYSSRDLYRQEIRYYGTSTTSRKTLHVLEMGCPLAR